MEALFKEFELDMMKMDHIVESAKDTFLVNYTRINSMENFMSESVEVEDMYTEEVGKVLTTIKNFFANLLKKIAEFVQKTTTAVKTKLAQMDAKKKLKSLKERMTEEASKKTIEGFFDSKKYQDALNKYIDIYVAETKKLVSKVYTDVDEYEKALKAIDEKLSQVAKDAHLQDNDCFRINRSVEAAMQFTEKEIDNYDQNVNAIQKKWDDAIKEFEKMAMDQIDKIMQESVVMEAEDDCNAVKASSIQTLASKLNTNVSPAFNTILKSPITWMTLLFAAAGTAITISAVKTFKDYKETEKMIKARAAKLEKEIKEFEKKDAEDKEKYGPLIDKLDRLIDHQISKINEKLDDETLQKIEDESDKILDRITFDFNKLKS